MLDKKVAQVREAAALASNLDPPNDQLAAYLLSKVPVDEHEESRVPTFYGVPKVHKKPVKMRPIVPCHSNAQAPAARYVSKQLQPLIDQCMFVLKGSKDLSIKLSQLRLPRGRKAWIISGDIVAYYPNIPLKKCLADVAKMCRIGFADTMTPEERHLFFSCFFLANKDLIIDFNGESAVQIRGLAMGIACSPDIANLYGASQEEPILLQTAYRTKVPFFGRYLDDLLGIVLCETADEAMQMAQGIRYDGDDIEC